MKKNISTLSYLAKTFSTVIGIVLIWRGIWYVLDALDKWFFGDSHFWTALLGIIVGSVILYLPDRNLKEIEKI